MPNYCKLKDGNVSYAFSAKFKGQELWCLHCCSKPRMGVVAFTDFDYSYFKQKFSQLDGNFFANHWWNTLTN
jgi:hypothetical protein